MNDADPTRFERAGGAQGYGVKTAVGIPLETPVVGRIVVALYAIQYVRDCGRSESASTYCHCVIEVDTNAKV